MEVGTNASMLTTSIALRKAIAILVVIWLETDIMVVKRIFQMFVDELLKCVVLYCGSESE